MPAARWFGLGDVVSQHATTRPGDIALVCGDHRLTWTDLDARVARLATVLHERGTRPGDRVLWLGQNCHRLLESLFACARLGAVLCPVNWRSSAGELAFVVSDAEPAAVLWQDEEIGPTVRPLVPTGDPRWIRHDGEYESLLSDAEPREAVPVDPADPVLMLYTAAFDGRPNGALLSHDALLSQAMTLRLLEHVGADEVFLNSGPLFHIGTLRRTLAVAHAGGRNVMLRRVEPTELCRLIAAESCTSAFLQRPTMEQMVVANADGQHDLSSLRTPPGPPGWDAMVTVVREGRVRSGYGQTELAGVVTFSDPGRPGIGGYAGPLAQVEVLDPVGRPAEVGEICVRGPMVMVGYHARPELSAQRQRFGWHHTGDLGRREQDGSISFVGPLRRIIKSAAENIYPAEVEAALARHPDVRRAAVIGLPDPTWGQRVLALVVPADPARADAEVLIEHCRGLLAGYKRPRAVRFVDAVPERDGGTDYDALDAAYGGGGYPGVGR